jgi:hypothetical protein
MAGFSTGSCDPDVANLTTKFCKLTVSPPPTAPAKPVSFLDLPTELRFIVYTYLSPHSGSTRGRFGTTFYSNLIRTCKQIRQEAPPEIEKVVKSYLRGYEKQWLEKHGEAIKITTKKD